MIMRVYQRAVIATIVWLGGCNPKPPHDGTADPPQVVVSHATLAFEDVRVFDGERFIERATVLVDGDRIVAVGPELSVPAGAERIAGEGVTARAMRSGSARLTGSPLSSPNRITSSSPNRIRLLNG